MSWICRMDVRTLLPRRFEHLSRTSEEDLCKMIRFFIEAKNCRYWRKRAKKCSFYSARIWWFWQHRSVFKHTKRGHGKSLNALVNDPQNVVQFQTQLKVKANVLLQPSILPFSCSSAFNFTSSSAFFLASALALELLWLATKSTTMQSPVFVAIFRANLGFLAMPTI